MKIAFQAKRGRVCGFLTMVHAPIILGSTEGLPTWEATLTPLEEQGDKRPTLRQEEEDLDWSENLARPRRDRWGTDVKIFAILVILSALLIVGLVYLMRGRL